MDSTNALYRVFLLQLIYTCPFFVSASSALSCTCTVIILHPPHITPPQMTQVIVLVPTSPAINMSLRGEISYTDSVGTRRRVFFDASLYVTDMIRWVIKVRNSSINQYLKNICMIDDSAVFLILYQLLYSQYNYIMYVCICMYLALVIFSKSCCFVCSLG